MLAVGVLQVQLRLRASHCLKDKRRVLRSLKDRLRSRYNVSVAEVDDQDLWQSLCLGFAMAGSDARLVRTQLEEIVLQLRSHPEAELVDHEIDLL